MRTLTALLITYDGRPAITIDELAALRAKSVKTIRNEISDKTCPVPMWKDGGVWQCHLADVARWLDQQREDAINNAPHLAAFREAA